MGALNVRLKRQVKSFAERTLGVSITRCPPAEPNKHADNALRYLRQWSSDDVVFDVGANDGRTVLRLDAPLSHPRMFAFEPVSATYRTLLRRTSHLSQVRAFPLALGATPGNGTIYLNEIDAMNSFSPRWTSGTRGTERVEVSTVDEIMARERIEMVHFLKVDTEGYELEVLKGAERALRQSRIAILQLEVGVDQMTKQFLSLEQARCYLAPRGYFLHGVYNQCMTPAQPPASWSPQERAGYRAEVLAYCDALFVRADL